MNQKSMDRPRDAKLLPKNILRSSKVNLRKFPISKLEEAKKMNHRMTKASQHRKRRAVRRKNKNPVCTSKTLSKIFQNFQNIDQPMRHVLYFSSRSNGLLFVEKCFSLCNRFSNYANGE